MSWRREQARIRSSKSFCARGSTFAEASAFAESLTGERNQPACAAVKLLRPRKLTEANASAKLRKLVMSFFPCFGIGWLGGPTSDDRACIGGAFLDDGTNDTNDLNETWLPRLEFVNQIYFFVTVPLGRVLNCSAVGGRASRTPVSEAGQGKAVAATVMAQRGSNLILTIEQFDNFPP